MSGGPQDRREEDTPRRPATTAGDGGGSKAGGDPCDIIQSAPLNSPRPATVQNIRVGDILDVVLNTSGARPVLEVHLRGAVAGSLTHTGHVSIIDCIRSGHRYVADVIARSGAAVDLQVRRA